MGLFSSLANGSRLQKIYYVRGCAGSYQSSKKFGIKVKISKNDCRIYGKGIDGYKYKKNLIVDAQNSGTLGRLILGLLINTPYPIKLIGDKSLSKRDFKESRSIKKIWRKI